MLLGDKYIMKNGIPREKRNLREDDFLLSISRTNCPYWVMDAENRFGIAGAAKDSRSRSLRGYMIEKNGELDGCSLSAMDIGTSGFRPFE